MKSVLQKKLFTFQYLDIFPALCEEGMLYLSSNTNIFRKFPTPQIF